MCGIFGYVGKKEPIERVVFQGLKSLDYRGYDSWGVAWREEKKLRVKKRVGKLPEKISLPSSTLAVGHTRWATHGGVTAANAHPHLSCDAQIAVVHNGIIENFEALKQKLLETGHVFKSETDTEVVAHLVEENLKRQGFAYSVRDAFNELKGLNAVVVANATSREIVAAKTGSPLVVGLGQTGYLIASDASSLLPFIKKVVYLADNQMVILGERLQLIKLPKGEKLKFRVEKLDWSLPQVSKENFQHFMIKEIWEQPQVIANIAKNYKDTVAAAAYLIKNSHGTFFIGCGSASYAALAGTYLFSKIADHHVNFTIGSEFGYLQDYLTNKSLVIAFSQSGETIDTIEPAVKAKERGAKVVAITNIPGSTLYRLADERLLLSAGPEKAVCATKTEIAMFSLILYLSFALGGKIGMGEKVLTDASIQVQKLLNSKKFVGKIKVLAKKLKNQDNIYIIGRGVSYTLALEAALKLKEVTYVHAEGFAGGELKHGVIALIEKGTPVIVFVPNDETKEAIIANAIEVKARDGFVIGIAPQNNKAFDFYVPIEDLAEAFLLLALVPMQLLAYFLAIEKGLDPDHPRNLAKSVTVK